MKIDPHKIGLAGAVASAILFTACSIFFSLWPAKMLEMTAALFHLNSFGPLSEYFELTAANYVSGLIQCAVYTYIYFYIFGYAYNRIQKR